MNVNRSGPLADVHPHIFHLFITFLRIVSGGSEDAITYSVREAQERNNSGCSIQDKVREARMQGGRSVMGFTTRVFLHAFTLS